MNASSTRKSPSAVVAMLLGVPLAVAALALCFGPLRHTMVFRYVEYPTQWVEVLFFCVGVGALLQKLHQWWGERAALNAGLIPAWDGQPQPIEKAGELLAKVEQHRASGSWLGLRAAALLRFVKQRGSADQVDEQLRVLSDADADANDSSYSFLRFITWAIPILGFLGTVIGITTAIGGVSPEALEKDMSSLTGGLAEAFDSTALALGLTMVLMFATHLVERMEEALLADVSAEAEEQLTHRFTQGLADNGPLVAAIQEQTAQLLAAQAGPIAQVVEMLQMRMMAAMQQGMGESLTQFAQQTGAIVQQLTALAAAVRETSQQQQQALLRVAESIAGQAAVLGQLQEGEANLVHLQAVLHQNLAAIASVSNFEQAVHSLTAAAHLLTARTSGGGPRLSIHGAAA